MPKARITNTLRRLLKLIPTGRLTDKFFLLTIFVYAHKRLPSKGSGLFNDYLYFLKTSGELLDILRQYTSDKVYLKSFVAERLGQDATLPHSEVYDDVSQITIDELPKPCVLKPAHGSGSVVFVDADQGHLTEGDVNKLQIALATSPYTTAREANYKHLRRRIVCEPMLSSGAATKDYKVFCYRGEPKAIQVDSERHSDHKRKIYTATWQPIDISYNFPVGEREPAPDNLHLMLDMARKLSSEFEFVRVDFFIDGVKVYVAELTHCPESAHGRFETREAERRFSSLIFR
ncbi:MULTISPECIES: ATP-grasp fold amidoligase family protein [unclassified Roseitalea]|uniref:ATP-grasp fold amidoligase family protein n=1 Tax=unclassified Roseitalea TaxID=2639107 RepID=UPI00273FF033|nr:MULTISPECIES: ATP-grasp fold amidoligase family protein [unclassified Roseitalea]